MQATIAKRPETDAIVLLFRSGSCSSGQHAKGCIRYPKPGILLGEEASRSAGSAV